MSKKHEPGMAYDMKKLNKVFALLSVVFFAVVIWVFLDDYIRPWKVVQLEAMKVKQEKLQEKLKEVEGEINQDKLDNLNKKLVEAEKIVAERKLKIATVQKKLDELGVKIKDETIINGQLNSKVSALAFNYGVAHANHEHRAESLYKKLRKNKKLFAESNDRKKAFQAEEKALKKQIESYRKEEIEIQKQIKDLTSTKVLVEKAMSANKITPVFVLRNLPFIDFMDPSLKVKQVVLDNITDDRYFQQVPKVDRCMTCHTFIDQPGFEDQPNPHKTHPNLELMVGMKSPHPMKKYGCTTCHGGEGHRVNDFSAAAHTPQNEEQAKEWVAKYNWHAPHKVAHPMFKLQQTEAGCVKCHNTVEFIPQATVLNEGRKNIEKFGCYACHKIEGWTEQKRKPAPSLLKISNKISKEFFKNWVWDPKTYNKHANMPAFFNQDNNRNEDFMKKNIAEVNAMAEVIWEKSEPYTPLAKFQGGNADSGKELIKSVGCMACHGVEGLEEASEKVGAYAGPYLTGTGSKVDPDWLVSWLIKPSHYQEDTIMPSFRLSNKEANDIAAYLLGLKNKKFEKLRFAATDNKHRDEILLTYFSAFDTMDVAHKRLMKMSDRERTLELGRRSIGKYGCYSCHNIDGFEGRGPIGPELTKVGSKPLTQFGFGHEHDVEHSRSGWIKAHLINPRRWDNGADKPFKDLLRMPNFYMTEEESESITVALLGQVSDYVPLKGVKRMDADEQIVNEGMKVVNKFNCIGCHKVDGWRGDITKMLDEDYHSGPPWLVGQGHRVQADWFHHFLNNVYPIRPWLELKMPSYNLSNEERNKIVAMFQHKAKQDTFENLAAVTNWEPGEREAAKQLFKSYDCASCHTSGFNKDEALAPNLYLAKRRLRPSWVHKWLKNPQAILPYTTMPNFWEDGEAQNTEILGGDPEKQIQALVKYIYEIGTDELPNQYTRYWEKN
jgi:mono/diheme cytochrome c family protein